MEPSDVTCALAATLAVASELGLRADDAIVLQNANRLAVRVTPCDVLARVAATVRRNEEGAAFEVDVARRLEDANCPIAVLEPRLEPTVYVRDGFATTFWTYYEPLDAGEVTPEEYAQALGALHAGLRPLHMDAPHFTDRVDEALSIVTDPSQSPELIDADRELLTDTLRGRQRSILDRSTGEQLLHGEPHEGNLLRTASGLRFIDLETCCYGPVEFDLAHAPIEVGRHYAGVDRDLLRDCRVLMLAMVAAWRSHRDDAYPDGRRNRDLLLATIRRTVERTS